MAVVRSHTTVILLPSHLRLTENAFKGLKLVFLEAWQVTV